jgi:calpain-15
VAHKRECDERIVLAHVETIRRTCSKTHSRFKDRNFSASPKSLYINGISLSKQTLALLPDQQTNLRSSNNQIQWLRPDHIVPEEWTDNLRTPWAVFRDPKPNDVLQGSLGDCWFITALSVLAEEPKYLMRVLITQQCNYEGIYCVRLCKGNIHEILHWRDF